MGTHHLGYKNCNNLTINIQSMLIFLINYNQLYVQVHIEFHIIICIVKYYMHPPIPKRKVQISRENINIMVNNIYINNVFFISVQTKRRSLIYIYIYLHSTRDRQFECCTKISLRKSAPKFNFYHVFFNREKKAIQTQSSGISSVCNQDVTNQWENSDSSLTITCTTILVDLHVHYNM